MRFVAIDFELANNAKASICQIGAVKYVNDQLVDQVNQLIDPECEFKHDRHHVGKHGIDEHRVSGEPTFPEYWDTLKTFIGGDLLVAHNVGGMEKPALNKTLERYELPAFEPSWECTQKRYEQIFTDYTRKGFLKLNKLSKLMGVTLDNHHDAFADAKACAELFIKAVHILNKEDVPFDEFLEGNLQAGDPVDSSKPSANIRSNKLPISSSCQFEKNDQLNGLRIGITYKLKSLPEKKNIEDFGAVFIQDPKKEDWKRLDIFVVGMSENSLFATRYIDNGYQENHRSGKWRRALEKEGEEGHKLKVIYETQLIEMLESEDPKSYLSELSKGMTNSPPEVGKF